METLLHTTGKLLFAILFMISAPLQSQEHKIKSITWKRIEVAASPDTVSLPKVNAIINGYKAKADSVMSPALGLSRVTMQAGKPESLLGNWAADMMVESSTATGLPQADMGLVNIGSLRGDIPEGIVRVGDIYTASPFPNTLVILEMKGRDMLKLMSDIATAGGEAVSGGVRMTITGDGRLSDVTLGGKSIDPKRIYRVATLDYLAEGNDKMFALKKAVKRHDTGMLVRDLMTESVIKNRIIDSKLEGRITVMAK